MAGMFSGFSKRTVPRYEKLYFEPNQYIVEISECKFIEGENDPVFIVQAKVLAKMKDTGEPPELGDKPSWVVPVRGKKEIWQTTLLQFLCSYMDCEPEEYDDDEWENIITSVFENNEWKGEVMKLKTKTVETKTGGDFTKHIWQGEPQDKDWDNYDLVMDFED